MCIWSFGSLEAASHRCGAAILGRGSVPDPCRFRFPLGREGALSEDEAAGAFSPLSPTASSSFDYARLRCCNNITVQGIRMSGLDCFRPKTQGLEFRASGV